MMGLGMRFRALVAAVGLLFLAVTVDAVAETKVNSVRLWRAPDNTRLVFDLTGSVQHSVTRMGLTPSHLNRCVLEPPCASTCSLICCMRTLSASVLIKSAAALMLISPHPYS